VRVAMRESRIATKKLAGSRRNLTSTRLALNHQFTVSVADPVIPPELAPMVVVPAPAQCARPPTLGALAIVAIEADEELQWLFRVMSCVVASLNVPVAVNCCVLPTVAVGAGGVTKSDTRVPVPTVRVVVPVTPEEDAEMVTDPPFLPCAIPELRTDARFGLEDFHVTPVKLVPVLPSLKVPVAVSLIDVPFAILGFAGVMLIETN